MENEQTEVEVHIFITERGILRAAIAAEPGERQVEQLAAGHRLLAAVVLELNQLGEAIKRQAPAPEAPSEVFDVMVDKRCWFVSRGTEGQINTFLARNLAKPLTLNCARQVVAALKNLGFIRATIHPRAGHPDYVEDDFRKCWRLPELIQTQLTAENLLAAKTGMDVAVPRGPCASDCGGSLIEPARQF